MALKQYLEILQEEMRRIDAITEENVRQYATYVQQVSTHTERREQRKLELKAFEDMFQSLAEPGEYQDNSRHVGLLQSMIAKEQEEIDENNKRINEKKTYYERLEEKDYERLWNNIERESKLAGIYFAYGDSTIDLDEITADFLSRETAWDEEILQYLLIKFIICKEARNEESEAILEQFVKLALPYSEGKDDKVWDAIVHVLGIYAAMDMHATGSKNLKLDENALAKYRQAIEDYQSTSEKVKTMIADLERTSGGLVRKEAAEIRKWYNEQNALWQNQLVHAKEIERKFLQGNQVIKNVVYYADDCMQKGMPLEDVQKEYIILNKMVDARPARRTELCEGLLGKGSTLLSEFQNKSTALDSIKQKRTNEKETRNAERVRERDRKKKARPAKLRTMVACFFIAFTLLLGPIGFMGNPIRNGDPSNPLVHNSYTPVSVTTARDVRCEVTGPFVFSLASALKLTLHIQTEKMPVIVTPLIGRQEWYIENEAINTLEIPAWVNRLSISDDRSNVFPSIIPSFSDILKKEVCVCNMGKIEEIIIEEGVTEVSITNCDTVRDIYLPAGIQYVQITDCDYLQNIHWPENIDFGQVQIDIQNNSAALNGEGV